MASRPRPILKAAGIVGTALAVIGAAMQYAVATGLIGAGIAGPVGAAIGFLLPLGAALGVWTFSEGHVTPVSDPQAVTGESLLSLPTLDDLDDDPALSAPVSVPVSASASPSDPVTAQGGSAPLYDATAADVYGRHAAPVSP